MFVAALFANNEYHSPCVELGGANIQNQKQCCPALATVAFSASCFCMNAPDWQPLKNSCTAYHICSFNRRIVLSHKRPYAWWAGCLTTLYELLTQQKSRVLRMYLPLMWWRIDSIARLKGHNSKKKHGPVYDTFILWLHRCAPTHRRIQTRITQTL